MRVVHVTQDDSNGGASLAAYRLHQGLLSQGIESTFYVRYGSRQTSDVITADLPLNIRQKFRQKWIDQQYYQFNEINASDNPHLLYSLNSPFDRLHEQLAAYDIINFHWISGFVDLPSFFKGLHPRQKVVWTLHDTAAITGACHYFQHCSRYTEQCGACFQLASSEENDATRQSWLRKKQFYQSLHENQLVLVTPSNWLKKCAHQSSLTKNMVIKHIPNGINPHQFYPLNVSSSELKKLFGIPKDKIVLLLIQKGELDLCRALEMVKDRDRFTVVEMGSPTCKIHDLIDTINLGNIVNLELKRLIYNLADVFVLPSPIDNYPNTLLESFACGTPALASSVGGIPEIVKHEERGWLYQFTSNEDLASKIQELASLNQELVTYGLSGRNWVIENTTIELQVSRYYSLYQNLLKR